MTSHRFNLASLLITELGERTNGKESWEIIQNPVKNPDNHQNIIDSYLGHAPPLDKISSNSVHNFFGMLQTDKKTCIHTENQTNTQPAQRM